MEVGPGVGVEGGAEIAPDELELMVVVLAVPEDETNAEVWVPAVPQPAIPNVANRMSAKV